jgi:hypothetical protein
MKITSIEGLGKQTKPTNKESNKLLFENGLLLLLLLLLEFRWSPTSISESIYSLVGWCLQQRCGCLCLSALPITSTVLVDYSHESSVNQSSSLG